MLTWVEISKSALAHNIQSCKSLLAPETKLCAVVKANAYGHDAVLAAKIFMDNGADWLAVHSIDEAQRLRDAGITAPSYILGYIELTELARVIELDCRLVVYNRETIDELARIGKPVRVHIKVETGTHRQGVLLDELAGFIDYVAQRDTIIFEGITTHFANIEDTTNRKYYDEQLQDFTKGVEVAANKGYTDIMQHCAAAGAAILFPESHADMVRYGVALYGMWPSEKLQQSFAEKFPQNSFSLQPAFTWKARIAQIKKIPAGKFIGYGCTYQTDRPTTMALIPIGYSDGYARSLSGKSHVLVHGKKAQLLGRVSMNNIVVDVTDIDDVSLEDEVVLLGKQGDAEITAEQFADWADTINYEIPTRIATQVSANIPRVVVE